MYASTFDLSSYLEEGGGKLSGGVKPKTRYFSGVREFDLYSNCDVPNLDLTT
jgi:hypothetical protein